MAEQAKVLIIDDDPSHLEIYSMLMEQVGLEPVTALVHFLGPDLPRGQEIDLVLLDSTLHSLKSAAAIAQDIHTLYPSAPIVVLSDTCNLAADIKPFAADIVRKGQPAELLETVCKLVPCPARLVRQSPAQAA